MLKEIAIVVFLAIIVSALVSLILTGILFLLVRLKTPLSKKTEQRISSLLALTNERTELMRNVQDLYMRDVAQGIYSLDEWGRIAKRASNLDELIKEFGVNDATCLEFVLWANAGMFCNNIPDLSVWNAAKPCAEPRLSDDTENTAD